VLIADRTNNRLVEVDPAGPDCLALPAPGDLQPGQSFRMPDDAFYAPRRRTINATQEDDYAISVIDVHNAQIVCRYGHPGIPGEVQSAVR